MKRKIVGILAVILVLMLAITGCFGGSDSSGDPDAVPTTVGEAPVADAAGEAVPEDVPIKPGAYNLDVIRSGTQVNYTIDGDIEDVMGWYQAELESYGWLPTRAPDSALGSIGTMSRSNEAGDSLSINMSYNQNGGFVLMQIALSRKNP